MTREGYTLMEIMVALVIFSIISAISLGTFASVMRSQQNSDHGQQSLNEIRFIMELLSREFRTSNGYEIAAPGTTGVCPLGAASFPEAQEHCILANNQAGNLVSYYRGADDAFHRLEQDAQSQAISHSRLSSNRVRLKELDAAIFAGEMTQEHITVIMEASYGQRDESPLIVQTTVTSRNYEN